MDSGTAVPSKLSGHRFDVSMLLVNFHGDGAQRVFLHLSEVFVRHGLRVEIIALNPGGRLRQYVSDGVRVVVLDCHVPDPNAEVPLASRILPLQADPSSLFQLARPVLLAQKTYPELNYLPDLVQKLRTSRPRAVVSALPQVNVLAVWASRLVHPRPRVVVIEHSVHTAAQRKKRFKRWFKRFQPRLIGRTYRLADAVVSVSNGVADDVTAFTGFPRERIQTIYNPVVPANVQELAGKAVCHPWFAPGEPPVILAAGRLHQLKDFPTLMRAFARVRERRLARLVIFGESEHGDTAEAQHALMKLAGELGVADDVSLPGWTPNLFAYTARAAVFALSSRWEGLPTVLIEALACGCPVVSTDCPGGTREVLDAGHYGRVVPVEDDVGLGDAICATLDRSIDRQALRARAQHFSIDSQAGRYLALLDLNWRPTFTSQHSGDS